MNSLEFTTKIERGVIHLPKEFEKYENKTVHVKITFETVEAQKTTKQTLLEKLATISSKISDETLEKLPSDGAENIDHYLYGSPKKDK